MVGKLKEKDGFIHDLQNNYRLPYSVPTLQQKPLHIDQNKKMGFTLKF